MRGSSTMIISVMCLAIGSGCEGDDLSEPRRPPWLPTQYTAKLDGANVVPPVESKAGGVAFLEFETASNQQGEDADLFYSFQISGVRAATWVLLRRGQVGQNGEILWVSCGLLEYRACPAGERIEMAGLIDASQFRGSLAEMNRLRKTVEAGEAYIEVASKTFPGGELRGQLQPVQPRTTP